MDEIKPCPNPGCIRPEDVILLKTTDCEGINYHYVCCRGCGMHGPLVSIKKQDAVTAWNNLPRGE